MSETGGLFYSIKALLEQDYRGVNIAVYGLATTGLTIAIHRIRPVSKFSKASKVPNHFIRNHVPLRGVYAGVQHSPVRVLVNHKAPIYLPLWHSSKPPLPIKLWGVDVVSGNAVSWLECVAAGQKVTVKPIGRENEALVSNVLLHLPQKKSNTVETLDIGKTLVELGFAQVSTPKYIQKNSIESELKTLLMSAETKAKSYRKGIWSNKLPPLPAYVVYWRKATHLTSEILVFTTKKSLELLSLTIKSALIGVKKLALKSFRATRKQIQTS